MRKVPMYVESENGHDEKLVPEKDLPKEVDKQLKDGKWVTVEKKDGSTEILTGKDLPEKETELPLPKKVVEGEMPYPESEELSDEDKELQANWQDTFKAQKDQKPVISTKTCAPSKIDKKTFEDVKTVTATSKAKGG